MRGARAFAYLLGPSALLCSACTVQAETQPVNSPTLTCTVSGEKHAGASSAEICHSFTSAITSANRGADFAVEVTALSPRAARAVARTSDGEVLLARDFDVMDAELGAAVWNDFAAQFARELTAIHSR